MPVSVLQQGPIPPCIFSSNTKYIKNSARDFKGEFFFFPANRTIQTVRQNSQKSEKAHFNSHKKKKESV